MKRAFTLIELCIVICVIGVLVGISLSGKSLLTDAKWRKDISQIRELEVDFYDYFNYVGEKVDILEIKISGRNLDSVNLDTMSNFIGRDPRRAKFYNFNKPTMVDNISSSFTFFKCEKILGRQQQYVWDSRDNGVNTDYCIIIFSNSEGSIGLSEYQLCKLETYLDDGNPYTGSGLCAFNSVTYDINANCDSLSKKLNPYTGWAKPL